MPSHIFPEYDNICIGQGRGVDGAGVGKEGGSAAEILHQLDNLLRAELNLPLHRSLLEGVNCPIISRTFSATGGQDSGCSKAGCQVHIAS